MKRTLLLLFAGLAFATLSAPVLSLPPEVPRVPLVPIHVPNQTIPGLTLVSSPENDGGKTTGTERSGEPKVLWDLSDPEIKTAYKTWAIAFMNRETEKYAEHKKAFAKSGSMSVVVFWVAQVLLLWAITAASIEFVRAQRVRTAAAETQELRVSLEGLALKTSLHGTLLLVIAMLFYYLFLKFVYPVTVVAA